MSPPRVSLDDTQRATRIAAVRARFDASGTSVADWARENGFAPNRVHQVLAGRGKWLRGETHRIAVALGLKEVAAPPEPIAAQPSRGFGEMEPSR